MATVCQTPAVRALLKAAVNSEGARKIHNSDMIKC